MYIIFNDSTRLEVNTIFGGKEFHNNSEREVLRIELPSQSLDKLEEIFSDQNKLKSITTDVNGDINLVGTDFTMLLSIARESRSVPHPNPSYNGVPTDPEKVTVVKIGQLTWVEKLISEVNAQNPTLIDGIRNRMDAPYVVQETFISEVPSEEFDE